MVESIYRLITSEEFIYTAVLRAPSTIMNIPLLEYKDQILLKKLNDKFDYETYQTVIKEIKSKIEQYLGKETDNQPNDYITARVYFKPKKLDENGIICRPLHTASLIDQIVIIALLQVLVYDYKLEAIQENRVTYKETLSSLCKIIPSNFLGNIIDTSSERLFKPWKDQYSEYCKKANECLEKYQYFDSNYCEISLDLKNFFPSINPKIVKDIIIKRLPSNISKENEKTLNKIVNILSFFKLDKSNFSSTDNNWYFDNSSHSNTFVKGIPQGLPHSYFFANIYMSEIRRIFANEYKMGNQQPEMYFYVDDSVIYTRAKPEDSNWFSTSINNINFNISQFNQGITQNDISTPQNYNYKDKDFCVEVHDSSEPNSKSVYSKIREARQDKGLSELSVFCREVSMISYEINTTYSKEELISLKSRVSALASLIETKINNSKKGKITTHSEYEKRLFIYKKFFKLREHILDFKTDSSLDSLVKKLEELISLLLNADKTVNKEAFIYIINHDILESLISYVFSLAHERNEFQKLFGICLKMREILKQLKLNNKNTSYLIKRFNNFEELGKGIKKYLNKKVNKYATLQTKIEIWLAYLTKAKESEKDSIIKEYLNNILEDNEDLKEDMFDKLDLKIYKYTAIYRFNSNEMYRMIINAIYSYMNSYTVSDSLEIGKANRQPITYTELRILNQLRVKSFNTEKFVNFWDQIKASPDAQLVAEYQLLQVMPIFRDFIVNPEYIDSLILVHKYCTDTWKNGSKQLYFYTLHNQEHAVALIKSIVQTVHTISHFQLKHYDFYLLFIACYLHDISMVRIPDESSFINDNTGNSDYLLEEVSKEKKALTSTQTKKSKNNKQGAIEDNLTNKHIAFRLYELIDQFLENEVRTKHTKNSATIIRNLQDKEIRKYLSSVELDIIAQISEAHGYDDKDIYYLQGQGIIQPYNIKQDKILLRLADLQDMDRYRISPVVLHNNLEKMNPISRFHWISHMLTSKCDIYTEYEVKNNNSQTTEIIETIIVKVFTRFKELCSIENKKCKSINCSISDDSQPLIIKINNSAKEYECSNEKCSLYCKWFVTKNNYLINELKALTCYLNRLHETHSYFFKSEAIICLELDKENYDMPQNKYDYLKQYLES